MKKILLPLALLFSLCLSAQTIPNSNFENWVSDNELSGWNARNASTLFIYNAPPFVLKSTNKVSGNFALTVKNTKGKVTNSMGTQRDTVLGGMITTEVSMKGLKEPGFLKGHINYSLVTGDTASVSISYKKSTPGGFQTRLAAIRNFTGSSGGYVPFTIPISPYHNLDRYSDTLFISITSYKFETEKPKPISELSTLTIDSLGFSGTMPAIQVPALGTILNGDFESWSTVNGKKEANNWHVYGTTGILGTNNVEQTNDFYKGNFAMRLTHNHVHGSGIAYTLTRTTAASKYLNGYAKFNLPASTKDTLNVGVFKYSKRQFFGGFIADKKFAGVQNAYTPFSISLGNTVLPNDTLLILFYYKYNEIVTNSVSTFWLDNVTLDSNPTGMEDMAVYDSGISISPNPSSSGIFNLNIPENRGLKVYNAAGTEIEVSISAGNEGITVDLSKQQRGLYFIHLQGTNRIFKGIY